MNNFVTAQNINCCWLLSGPCASVFNAGYSMWNPAACPAVLCMLINTT